MAYDNRNSGILSRNARKQQDNHPDFTGSCEVGDPPVHYWISGWVKVGKPGSKIGEGKKFFSLSFKPKDAPAGGGGSSPARPSRGNSTPPPASAPSSTENLDEEIPY